MIEAPFKVEEGQAKYVACHNESYVQAHKCDVVKQLKQHGIFFLNTGIAAISEPEKRIEALEQLAVVLSGQKLVVRGQCRVWFGTVCGHEAAP